MLNKKKISIIIQARLGSTRFPKNHSKVLKKPLILILIERLKNVKKVDDILVAIPDNKNNEPLFKFLKKIKLKYLGDLKNTLSRYYYAAKKNKRLYCKNYFRLSLS